MTETPLTLAAVLARALERKNDTELSQLAERIGVPRDVVVRAANGAGGQPTRANHYLRICAGIGLDPETGVVGAPWPPADIDTRLFAMGVRMARYEKKHGQRDAAAAMGISATAVSRIENGDLRSFEGMMAACRYARLHPLNYFVPLDHQATGVVSRGTTGKRLTSKEDRAA